MKIKHFRCDLSVGQDHPTPVYPKITTKEPPKIPDPRFETLILDLENN